MSFGFVLQNLIMLCFRLVFIRFYLYGTSRKTLINRICLHCESQQTVFHSLARSILLMHLIIDYTNSCSSAHGQGTYVVHGRIRNIMSNILLKNRIIYVATYFVFHIFGVLKSKINLVLPGTKNRSQYRHISGNIPVCIMKMSMRALKG